MPEALRESLVEAALEGGGWNGSTIWQSGGDDGKAWDAWVSPLSGVVSRIGVRSLMVSEPYSESGIDPRSLEQGIGHAWSQQTRCSSV